jgi:hypothetical protein
MSSHMRIRSYCHMALVLFGLGAVSDFEQILVWIDHGAYDVRQSQDWQQHFDLRAVMLCNVCGLSIQTSFYQGAVEIPHHLTLASLHASVQEKSLVCLRVWSSRRNPENPIIRPGSTAPVGTGVEGRSFTQLIFFSKNNAASIQLASFWIRTTDVFGELSSGGTTGLFFLVPSERKSLES